METFNVQSTNDQFIITVNRSLIDLEFINNFFSRIRLEELIKKADFKEEVIELGKEIKKEWWDKNKEQYLSGK